MALVQLSWDTVGRRLQQLLPSEQILGEKCHNISEHCMDPDAGCEEEVDLEVGICLAELSDLQVCEDDLQVYEGDLHGPGPGEVPASCQ